MQLLADALIDQHVGIHRDADGQHNAGDARQRQRGVKQRQDAENHRYVDRHRDVGDDAEQPVGQQHEHEHEDRADIGGTLAGKDRVLAEAGTDGAFLDHRERRRQRAGAQQDGEVVSLLHGEIAGNLARTAGDRFADDRRGDHFVVEHDGKRQADVLGGGAAELAGAGGVELERDDRLAGALIEPGLRVGEVGARHQHLLLDHVRLAALGLRAVQQLRIRRHPALARLLRRDRVIDHAEVELGGLAEQFLEAGRVLQARHLNENAVEALTLDQRFDSAEFVDAPLDDLDRLLDRLADAVVDRRERHGQADQPVAGVLDLHGALAAGAEDAAERLRQFAQLGQGLVEVLRLDAHLDGAVAGGKPGVADLGIAQRAAHVVADLLELVLAHRIGIDLEQHVRAALQIEAEHEVALRPCRPGLDRIFGEEIRDGERANDERRQNDPECLPPRKIQHQAGPCDCWLRGGRRIRVRSRRRRPWRCRPCPCPWPARPWRARRRSSAASGGRARPRRPRPRSARHQRPW